MMTKLFMIVVAGLLLQGIVPLEVAAQPPALVVVEAVSSGELREEKEFVGTVYFQETSLVAAEVSGRVTAISFEQGDRVRRGQRLVRMDGALKALDLESRQAQREEVLAELSRVQRELNRMRTLFEQNTIAEQEYEKVMFLASALERRVDSLAAEIAKIREEITKLDVTAPFDGVVLARRSNLGEWLSPGAPVAELGRFDMVDILVNVPVDVAQALTLGQSVAGQAFGRALQGRVAAIVPKGDVGTRTFPVKIRLVNEPGLMEGMEVRVFLPTGEHHQGLLVPRDAVVPGPMGQVVFVVRDNQAKMVPVNVAGFSHELAGIQAQGLEPGELVVVKGQERLRDGQPVRIEQ
ncbi:MAG TPA: efflux RND transporter periplasmic adaptor subunit [Desulfonatronum sp.]|nr:efflux RND transporter periplasmic adaptor subunit [Desulfonatronum sp.]